VTAMRMAVSGSGWHGLFTKTSVMVTIIQRPGCEGTTMPKHTEGSWHEVFEFALNSILNLDEHDVLVMHALWVSLEEQRCLTASPKAATRRQIFNSNAGCVLAR
jgi:hypothetical protein